MSTRKPVILYDGYCRLCSSSLQFVIKRDKKHKFRYESLQSDEGARLLSGMPKDKQQADSIVYFDGKNYYQRSTAILKILKRLGRGWDLLHMMVIIPRPVRDFFYDLIARYRFRWFGKRKTCFIPEVTDPDLTGRN